MASSAEQKAIEAIAEAPAVGHRHEQAALRLQHAADLPERAHNVAKVLQAVMADDQVEALAREWQGVYFYGDYCSGNIWGLRLLNGSAQPAKILFKTDARITTFGVDENGEIYLADYGSGQILQLERR